MTARRVRISGNVQGVGFRYWVIGEARKRALDGWVRNRRDSTVEAVFHGPLEAVEAMVEACRVGPPAAWVANVEVKEDSEPPTSGFRSLPTL